MKQTQKITTFVQKPHLVAILDKEKGFIGGENGFELINLNTNESIKKECFEGGVYDVATNPPKTKFGITVEGKVIRYNAHFNEKEWEEDTHVQGYNSLSFNSQDENQMITHICTTNLHDGITCLSPNLAVISHSPGYHICSPIYCHPTESVVVWITEHHALEETTSLLRRRIDIPEDNVGQYTPDGSILLNGNNDAGTHHVVCLLSEHWTDQSKITEYRLSEDSGLFSEIIFYSKNIIALLLKNSSIEYWNYKKKTLLATTATIVQHKSTLHAERPLGKRIAFFPNGLYCLVALSDDCYIVPVPTEIIFKKNTKQILFSTFCLMYKRELTLRGNDGTTITEFLPDEVVYLILQKLLLMNKRKSILRSCIISHSS